MAIERTGYDASLLTEFLGVRKLANLRKLIDMARQFDQSGLFTLADFVDRLRDAVADETHEPLAATHPESSDVIRLMSIHQSKGLEFPVVVVADMDRPMNSQLPPAHFDARARAPRFASRKIRRATRPSGAAMSRWQREGSRTWPNRAGVLRRRHPRRRPADSVGQSQTGRTQATNPWLKLLAERFDLLTGQPRQAPATGGISILAKYSSRLPEILVHHSVPKAIDLAAGHQAHGRRRSTASANSSIRRFRTRFPRRCRSFPPIARPGGGSAYRKLKPWTHSTVQHCQVTSAADEPPPFIRGARGSSLRRQRDFRR